MAKFTVDTHLFRELGDLLVGRDSTALVELIKNAYDADAARVAVYGQDMEDTSRGFIRISDNGIGMTLEEFTQGFLRIASRVREKADRVSRRYKRRYTGAKGIGRLAAHKLGRLVEVASVPWSETADKQREVIDAKIDWDLVEQYQTLDDLENTDAIVVAAHSLDREISFGTTITLRRPRRRWTSSELGKFLSEVQTFEPPQILVQLPSRTIVESSPLFDQPTIRESAPTDPGFHIELEGEFEVGDEYWQALVRTTSWVIEIDALSDRRKAAYRIAPTRAIRDAFPGAAARDFVLEHPDPNAGPFFQSRILLREGRPEGNRAEQTWQRSIAGIRVFMEGFRILPYGDQKNDWLSLDSDYARRTRVDPLVGLEELAGDRLDKDEFLIHLPNRNYFGAVFLTQAGAPTLKLVVNREGFVPDPAFENLVKLVRTGTDLATRVRAAVKAGSREERRTRRKREAPSARGLEPLTVQELEEFIGRASSLAREAEKFARSGDIPHASQKIVEGVDLFQRALSYAERLISERSMVRVLASVGTQMAGFVHELNALLAMSQTVEKSLNRVRDESSLSRQVRSDLAKVIQAIGDLRRNLERQASYLVDIITPDARRRRSRQNLTDRFESGRRLVEHVAERQGIHIVNEIPADLKSPPMFPAELIAIFSNLLTNAVKAAGKGGRIRARAGRLSDGQTRVVLENTGVRVDLNEGERWFQPFESTTATVDAILGQGMGLGLPITRSILEEYGAEIKFAKPGPGYSTAVEILFPE